MTASIAVSEMIKMLTAMGVSGPGMVTFDGKRGLGWTSVPAIPSTTCEVCMPLRHISVNLATASVADCLVALQQHPDVQKLIKGSYDGKKLPSGRSAASPSSADIASAPFILNDDEHTVKVNLDEKVLQRRDNPFSLLFDTWLYMTPYLSKTSMKDDREDVSVESAEFRKVLEGLAVTGFSSPGGADKFRASALDFTTPYLIVGCANSADTIRVHVILE
eukprot:TRINITY_DN26318_c0_g1_i6.p1 TRINITY_DN26318_c0_g1~~TRINITY_DN26318_c0_g1_i6.p1  ORF type:complete len:219 (-),score=36.94 TRINITY_DN26318_c0_g1_i6:372-1028(-)